ncbi:MAG: response regulator [Planctomycetota bacterium]|nr:response regulator [Planctomycetota bacterium]
MGPSPNGPLSYRSLDLNVLLVDDSPVDSLGLHVLLVDDNPLCRAMTSIVLQNLGLLVTCVNDGNNAVAALQKQDFDVVLMDVEMSGMDGITATVEIRQREVLVHKYTPIVALTSTTDRDRCFAAGMDGFIPKPLMPGDLEQIYRIVTDIRSRPNACLA